MSKTPESSALAAMAAEIVLKAKLEPLKANDCRKISAAIFLQTGKAISETTLKRLFGFAVSSYKLSAFTKNVLSNYLGFTDWDGFVANLANENGQEQKKSYWNKLQIKANIISTVTYTALKNRSGIPFKYTVHRKFAEDQIRYFLGSDYLATSFLAPGGYGKSILLTQLIEKFWLGDTPEFKNDIVWFVSGQTIGGLLNKGFDLNDWFMNQMGLTAHETVHEYFSLHPQEIGGRLIIILDGFDEIIHQEDELQTYFSRILDFITLNQEFNWIKIIISARSYTWSFVSEQIDESSFIKDHWYLGNTFNSATQINVPLLCEAEIQQVLANLSGKDISTHGLEPEIVSQLSNPYYVQLLFQLKMISPGIEFFKDKFNYFDLIAEFIRVKIYQDRYSSDKIAIIKRFLDLTNLGSNTDYVEKMVLISEPGDLKIGYQELISYGVLVEENLSNKLNFKQVVYVNHLNLLEYFIAREFLTNHRFRISADILISVNIQYARSRFKIPLLRWIIYFAVNTNQLASLPVLMKFKIDDSEKEKMVIFLAELARKKYLTGRSKNSEETVKEFEIHPYSLFLRTDFKSNAYQLALSDFYLMSKDLTEKICITSHIAYHAIISFDMPSITSQLKTLAGLNSSKCMAFVIDPALIIEMAYDVFCTRPVNQKSLTGARELVLQNYESVEDPYFDILFKLAALVNNILEDSVTMNISLS